MKEYSTVKLPSGYLQYMSCCLDPEAIHPILQFHDSSPPSPSCQFSEGADGLHDQMMLMYLIHLPTITCGGMSLYVPSADVNMANTSLGPLRQRSVDL